MEKIILTEEQMQKAVSYAPAKVKEAFVDYCCRRCLSTSKIDLGIGENSAMPNMYMEDTFAKSRYLMSALCVLYLGVPRENVSMEGDDLWLMEEAEYDLYAMSHPVNQIERMKSNAELRDKAFDLLRDYRDLEKRLNTAIYNTMTVMNDPINRMFQKLAADTSAEALEEQKKAAEELARQLEELKALKEAREKEA